MARPRLPHTRALLQILSDAQWHTRDELVAKAGILIPPGQAIRRRNRDKQRLVDKARRLGTPPVKNPTMRSDEFKISVGRRAIIADVLTGLAGLETKKVDGVIWVRSNRPLDEEGTVRVDNIEWGLPPIQEPEPDLSPRDLAPFVQSLRAHPGEWAKVPRAYSSHYSAKRTALQIAAGTHQGFTPKGAFDSVVNGVFVYVKYLGEPSH